MRPEKAEVDPGDDLFRLAAQDYLYLCGRGYKDKSILKLIGDRYHLSRRERSRLLRGIFPLEINRQRTDKLCGACSIHDNMISIDGFNVLYTIASYLSGKDVYLATDGFLRDSAETHGKPYRRELRHRAWKLLLDYLIHHKPSYAEIFFDEPISNSGEMAKVANTDLFSAGIKGKATTVASPDHWLIHASKGLVASSDTVIIDSSPLQCIDLPYMILKTNFHPVFPELATIIAADL